MWKTLLFLLTGVIMVANSSSAATGPGKPVTYKEGSTELAGYLATPAAKGRHAAIIIFHDWMGNGDFSKARADKLAPMGYVAFAADVYGKGVRPKSMKEAAELAGKYKADRPLMRARAKAALDYVKKLPIVDPPKVIAIGYCFGGTVALELARSGAPLAGTVSFHGGLDTPTPADAKNIKGKVLALHGADDPNVPVKDVLAFEQEMKDGHVDWELDQYGNAVHAFTNPAAGNDNSKGAAYNAQADARSWDRFTAFLVELTKPVKSH